jgi:hypothetical protein
MDAFWTLLGERELAIRGRLLASKYYTKITPEGMRLRLIKPMCWFLHCIDNSVSSSNIIDGGSQFIGKQWEHHIKTNGSKTMAAGVPHIQWTSCVFMSYACSFFSRLWSCKVYWVRISLYHCNDVCWHCRHECISDDNEWEICFMRTWEITQILQFTVLTNVDVNGSQIVKVYCYWTMKC